MIGDFESFNTLYEITKIIKPYGNTVTIISNTKLNDGDLRPAFQETEIEIYNFKDLDENGRLRMRLNNNRLFEIRFYPENINRYVNKLNNKHHFILGENLEIKFDKNTYVKQSDQDKEVKYIEWQDKTITNEIEEWILRFS